MKVIDLLSKIANGEELPKRIYYKGDIWHLEQDFSNRLPYYKNGYNMDNLLSGEEKDYFSHALNDEVEILEEEKKIPEKITMRAGMVGSIDNKLENLDINTMAVEDKINDIIDYLVYLKSKGE